jgi:hypothetical protein
MVPGKFNLMDGLRVMDGAGGGLATAVPASKIRCGLPGALSVMESEAWLEPTEDGA